MHLAIQVSSRLLTLATPTAIIDFHGTQLALRAALSVPHKWRKRLQHNVFAVG